MNKKFIATLAVTAIALTAIPIANAGKIAEPITVEAAEKATKSTKAKNTKKKKTIGTFSMHIEDPGEELPDKYWWNDGGDFSAKSMCEVAVFFYPNDQKGNHKYALYEITEDTKNKVIDLKQMTKKATDEISPQGGRAWCRKFAMKKPYWGGNSEDSENVDSVFVVMDENGRKSDNTFSAWVTIDQAEVGRDESTATTVYIKKEVDGEKKWVKVRSYEDTWIDTKYREKGYDEFDELLAQPDDDDEEEIIDDNNDI